MYRIVLSTLLLLCTLSALPAMAGAKQRLTPAIPTLTQEESRFVVIDKEPEAVHRALAS